jgi:enterochelin esterase-like enzyme
VEPDRTPVEGAVFRSFESKTTGGAVSYFVYLPPGYDSASERKHRYPVVYLLHGFPGYAVDWFRAGMAAETENALLKAHVIRPVILVAPTVNNDSLTDYECLDAPRGPKLDTYLTSYLVDQIDHRFRTVRSRLGRAIGGFSSGADCALNLGLRHLDRFSAIFAHTVTGEPGTNALHDVLHGDKRAYAANAPFLYLPKMRFTHPVAVYLDSGDANPHVVTREHLLDAELRARGQVVALRIARGQGHTWYEARDGLPYSLSFAAHLMFFEPPRVTRSLERAACSLEQGRRGRPVQSVPTARPEVPH